MKFFGHGGVAQRPPGWIYTVILGSLPIGSGHAPLSGDSGGRRLQRVMVQWRRPNALYRRRVDQGRAGLEGGPQLLCIEVFKFHTPANEVFCANVCVRFCI